MLVGALLLALLVPKAGAGPLDYRPGPFPAELRPEGPGRYVLNFPSPLKSPFLPNDTVWGHLSLPEGPGPFPCILVLPVMAAPNVWIERRFINRFEAAGFAVLWLEMPYQFHRRPRPLVPSGEVFLARTADRLAFNFRQSALDARRALDWLSGEPRIDKTRIGLFGISLGALVGSAVYSVDSRPAAAAFLLGGADFPDLVYKSAMTAPFLKRAGIPADALKKAWRGLDPLDYRQANRGKKVLLVNALWDWVIPASNGRRLAEAFPDAHQFWVPLGHYSSMLHLIWMPRYAARYFEGTLGKNPEKNGLRR